MNIFYLDPNPQTCAEMHCDKHVVKMIIEYAQLMSTAHRVLDGEEYIENKIVYGSFPYRYRKMKRWRLPDDRETILYSATHINHPSAVWCRQSHANYNWLYRHFKALLNEYTYRYGKQHKCNDMAYGFFGLTFSPKNIPFTSFTPVHEAMAPEYIVSNDSVQNYRNYYKQGKKHLHKWTKREMPDWMAD